MKDKKSTKEDKIIALKFLVHLIGDLHQPLHVGNGKDRGGNDIKVKWFGEATNLHNVWDEKLINLQELSYTEYSNYLLLNIDYSLIREWQGANILEFINESKNLEKNVTNLKMAISVGITFIITRNFLKKGSSKEGLGFQEKSIEFLNNSILIYLVKLPQQLFLYFILITKIIT